MYFFFQSSESSSSQSSDYSEEDEDDEEEEEEDYEEDDSEKWNERLAEEACDEYGSCWGRYEQGLFYALILILSLSLSHIV